MFHRPFAATHRLFFALVPPIQLARQIANAAHWFADSGTPVSADRLHMTLFILDDLPEVAPDLRVSLGAAAARIAVSPVTVLLDRVSGGAQSIALRPQHHNPALVDLHRTLADVCARERIAERQNYRFSPHMTLGYRKGEPFGERIAPVVWQAEEVVLIHSHVGRTRHEVIGRWPLAAEIAQLALF